MASAQLDERQREINRFLVLSLQKSVGDLNYQLSAFHQHSELHYTPDPLGDLIYTGVASDTLRANAASEAQFDASYKLNDSHTVRTGVAYTHQDTRSDNTVGVFDLAADGSQAANTARTIIDNSRQTGKLSSVYLQDEWHIAAPLTLNYGIRYDKVQAFINEQQWSHCPDGASRADT